MRRRRPARWPVRADVDVPGFVAQVADGEPVDAAQTIFAENLLGGTCARVCPVEILCEGACVLLHDAARPIPIGALQRYATDRALEATAARDARRRPLNGRRSRSLGAGPAGLAARASSRRAATR